MAARGGLTQFLARRALLYPAVALPEDVRRRALHSLLDWLSVALAGCRHEDVQKLAGLMLEEGGPPQCTVFGSRQWMASAQAAVVNGMAGHVLDFDDTHLPSRVHPSAPLWPAILACAQCRPVTGMEVIAAFVAGVDVQSRLAFAMGEPHYRLGWHNTATLGAFGAAAAVGRLLRLDVPALAQAFGIVASDAAGMRSAFGTACKPLQVGTAAAKGAFAANLAARGFPAPMDTFDRPDGFAALYASDVSPSAARLRLKHWHVRDIVFKYHASCYGTQAPANAVSTLLEGRGAAEVERFEIAVEPQYVSVCGIPEPRSAEEARFSIAHMVALAALRRDTASDSGFSETALADPNLRAVRKRVTVVADATLGRGQARATLRLSGGRCLALEVDAGAPEPRLEVQEARLLRKSSALLSRIVSKSDIKAFHEHVLALTDVLDAGYWMADLTMMGLDRAP